jgi:predicted nucleic acid-binding Zn ribbon protein
MGGGDAGVVGLVFSHWEEAVGPAIADHATPLSLRDGVLVVGVGEPAWATQLRFLERQILDRLRDAAGADVATRIEVRVKPSGGGRRRPR